MPAANHPDTEEAEKQDIQNNRKTKDPRQDVNEEKQVKLKELVSRAQAKTENS